MVARLAPWFFSAWLVLFVIDQAFPGSALADVLRVALALAIFVYATSLERRVRRMEKTTTDQRNTLTVISLYVAQEEKRFRERFAGVDEILEIERFANGRDTVEP